MSKSNKKAAQKIGINEIVVNKTDTYFWKAKIGEEVKNILMKDMTEEHLQKAYLQCQARELKLHNQMLFQSKLASMLEEVAKEKGIELKDLDQFTSIGDYFKNTRILKGKE